MASTWGSSWGGAWGSSWGGTSGPVLPGKGPFQCGLFQPNVFQNDCATGGAVYTGGWEEFLASRVRDDRWRDEVAEEVAAKRRPAEPQAQEAALEVAAELLAGNYVNDAAALDEMRRVAALRAWRWRSLYGDLVIAYRDELKRQRSEFYGRLLLERLELEQATLASKRKAGAAMLFLLAQM